MGYLADMTTLSNRPDTALLVIDVQNDVVANGHNREGVLANIDALVTKARSADVPVIWVQHNDEGLPANTEGWQIAHELDPRADETIVHKQNRDSFEETTLEDELAAKNIGHLVVAGSQSDFCVRWTLHGARVRGYDTTLVADAHTTDDPPTDKLPSAAQVIAHTNTIWGTQGGTDLRADVAVTSDVTFG